MSEIQTSDWSETANSNTAAPPNGAPEDMDYSAVNDTIREHMAAVKRDWNRNHTTVTSGGTANAQTLTYTTAPASLVAGMEFAFIAGALLTNTDTMTLNTGTGGALTVYKIDGTTALAAGDVTAGEMHRVVYSTVGTNHYRLVSPYRVPDNGITLAKMEHGTQGDILYYGATGTPTRLAAGTSGQVLATQGAGANPQWASSANLTAASQAEMESASSTSVAVTPGRAQYHPGMAKAWGFVTMSAGTPSLTAGYNCSITDSGTGLVTVTIATDFSSRNYAVVFGSRYQSSSSGGYINVGVKHDSAPAAGSFVIQITEEDGAESDDWSEIYFACFGDQ